MGEKKKMKKKSISRQKKTLEKTERKQMHFSLKIKL